LGEGCGIGMECSLARFEIRIQRYNAVRRDGRFRS
jgi:hypothetical protein